MTKIAIVDLRHRHDRTTVRRRNQCARDSKTSTDSSRMRNYSQTHHEVSWQGP